MRLAAGGAAANQESALRGGIPKRLRFRVRFGSGDFSHRHGLHSRSRIRVAPACRVASEPPVPWASARSQFLTCTAGCASPRNWRTASITLVMPPRLAGWLLHSPPPSVLNGSLPLPEIRLPSATNFPPSPFLQRSEEHT